MLTFALSRYHIVVFQGIDSTGKPGFKRSATPGHMNGGSPKRIAISKISIVVEIFFAHVECGNQIPRQIQSLCDWIIKLGFVTKNSLSECFKHAFFIASDLTFLPAL